MLYSAPKVRPKELMAVFIKYNLFQVLSWLVDYLHTLISYYNLLSNFKDNSWASVL